MKEKIAILLYGISYLENFIHFKGRKLNIDYRNSIENYKEYLFEYYKNYDIEPGLICLNAYFLLCHFPT